MTNSLSELSATYEKSIALQQEIIDKTRLKLKKASAEFNFKEIERLNSLLRVLYDEKRSIHNKYCSWRING